MESRLQNAIKAVEEQSLRNRVAVSNKRDLPSLRAYMALCERDHGSKQNSYSLAVMAKARRLLAQAEVAYA